MKTTTVEQWVFRIAGVMILLSLALAHYVHPGFLWFTAFVGANMFQASFTGLCPLAMMLKWAGLANGPAFCPADKS